MFLIGIEVKYKNQEYPVIINPMNIPELLEISQHRIGIEIGSAAPISKIEDFLTKYCEQAPGKCIFFMQIIIYCH